VVGGGGVVVGGGGVVVVGGGGVVVGGGGVVVVGGGVVIPAVVVGVDVPLDPEGEDGAEVVALGAPGGGVEVPRLKSDVPDPLPPPVPPCVDGPESAEPG
jgi:hypothetical protein